LKHILFGECDKIEAQQKCGYISKSE